MIYNLFYNLSILLYNLIFTARILKNRSHSIGLNHLNKSIMEHNQTRWYKVLKIMTGNRIE